MTLLVWTGHPTGQDLERKNRAWKFSTDSLWAVSCMEIAGNDLCTRQGALKSYSSSGQRDVSYPLKIEQVLLKGLPGLCLLTLVYNIRILFVPTAFVVLAAVSLPVSQTHPAEVCRKQWKSTIMHRKKKKTSKPITLRKKSFRRHSSSVFIISAKPRNIHFVSSCKIEHNSEPKIPACLEDFQPPVQLQKVNLEVFYSAHQDQCTELVLCTGCHSRLRKRQAVVLFVNCIHSTAGIWHHENLWLNKVWTIKSKSELIHLNKICLQLPPRENYLDDFRYQWSVILQVRSHWTGKKVEEREQ